MYISSNPKGTGQEVIGIGISDKLDLLKNKHSLQMWEFEQDLLLTEVDFRFLLKKCNGKFELSPMEKKCIYLFFWKNLKYKKINECLKTSACGCYIKRARLKMKQALKGTE